MIARARISLGILAGGQARRLGGVDKAFAEYRGQPLVERSLRATGNGYAQMLISHPAQDSRFDAFGLRAVPDLRPAHPGPLAGLEALMQVCTSDWLLTLPVDLARMPGSALASLASIEPVDGSALCDGDGLQPLCALWRVATVLPVVSRRLDDGQWSAHGLFETLTMQLHDISPLRLGNLNSPGDFEDANDD
ncbi:MAG TPA: molybdenum cofactor guanylyltransferase [Arenimonas sp.]|uniref:molybdenum cofactor guanylyltransferase n=1 Tax=Arenimonas sp. TaxID=1872635 RepID=UPI002CE3E54D|nr:molybdenum cofactor guanylyltransferase [Arenimonas sp.]HMB57464.1 molybdenum cofactor guanylyltransferase [Arenimonas sp.]